MGESVAAISKAQALVKQSLHVQIPVRDEVSDEDAAQYFINPVTGGPPLHRSPKLLAKNTIQLRTES